MAAAGTGVGRESLLVVCMLARVLVLVREVVVAVLRMEERSEAEVDVRDARDDLDVNRVGGKVCGGGGGGMRRVVVAIDEEEIERTDNFGDAGTERGGGGGVGANGGGTDEGDLDDGL